MDDTTLDKISDTKCDQEYTLTGGREPREYTAGVKIWEIAPNTFYLDGYWDMPQVTEGLGTPVTIHAQVTKPGSYPTEVMKEAQDFLLHGLNIMDEQGIRVTKKARQEVFDMVQA